MLTVLYGVQAVKKRVTKRGGCYWGGSGAYQKEYGALYDKLIPPYGEAATVHGEMIRAVTKLNYDYFNNGNCNLHEEYPSLCGDCEGRGCLGCHYNGYTDDEFELEWGFQAYVDFLKSHLKDLQPLDALLRFFQRTPEVVWDRDQYTLKDLAFDDDELKLYSDLMDAVMYQVLTTPNKPRK